MTLYLFSRYVGTFWMHCNQHRSISILPIASYLLIYIFSLILKCFHVDLKRFRIFWGFETYVNLKIFILTINNKFSSGDRVPENAALLGHPQGGPTTWQRSRESDRMRPKSVFVVNFWECMFSARLAVQMMIMKL